MDVHTNENFNVSFYEREFFKITKKNYIILSFCFPVDKLIRYTLLIIIRYNNKQYIYMFI